MRSYSRLLASVSCVATLSLGVSLPAQAAFLHTSGGSIDGSLCVGNDCIASESFGFDTIRLKENNLRVHFDDTSVAGSFSRNDWRIIINDSTNGGASKFAVEDSTGARTPFTILAGARTNALFVDAQGDVGIGTSTPATDIDIKVGDSPTVRLQQDGSSGFAPQTWDMAGNETSFFIRDATGGSTLPFRIMGGGAPSNALVIANTGFVGMGTTSPTAALHVRKSDGTAQFLVEENSTTVGNLTMMFLDNAGGRPRIQMTGAGNAAQTGDWSISAGDTFVLQDRTNGDNEMVIDQSGNMTILGSLTTGGTGACSATPCDAVFDTARYTVPSIEEHAALMWDKKHLPAVGPTGPGMQINMTEKMLRMLNELEHAHIYIDQLNQQMQAQSTEIAELKTLVAAK
jgi:hypothetical protein